MYNIGFDLGSSSVKVAITDAISGKKVISLHEPIEEMPIIALQSDWAEQDPMSWWYYLCTASKKAIATSKIDAAKITAIGISYQMHGLVIVDEMGAPLRDAIIWCDSRAVAIGNKAYNDLGKDVCGAQFLNSPGNFTASKLKWVKENEPEIYDKIYKYMLPGDFISYQLTGEIATTKNGLSEGILWDYKNNTVASKLLNYYGIDQDLTPSIVENFSVQGAVHELAAEATGLPKGIPVTYRAGDQPNNALSLNVFNAGEVAMTGGTSGVVYAVTNNESPNEVERINHFAHVNHTNDNSSIGKLLCINGAGIQYRWLKNICGEKTYEEMNAKVASVPIGSEGVVVLPFGNGAERMLYNKNVGMHLLNVNLNGHSNGHLYRAALEGIAFSFVYGVNIMEKDEVDIQVMKAGNDNLFRSEIFSNTVASLLGKEIEIYNTTGAVGAARAAGLLDGDFSKFGEHSINNDFVKTFTPVKNTEAYQEAYQKWLQELEVILKK